MIKNMVGATFPSLAQRVIYPFIATYPSPSYHQSCGVSEEAQMQSYKYMKQMLHILYETPSIIHMPAYSDAYDGLGDRNEFLSNYRKVEAKLYRFLELLVEISARGEVTDSDITVPYSLKINKNKEILNAIGLTVECIEKKVFRIVCPDYPLVFQAWKKLATQPYTVKTRFLTFFLLNKYQEDHETNMEKLFGSFVESPKALRLLDDFFGSHGFSLNCHMGVTWEKIYPHKKKARFDVNFKGAKQYQIMYSVIIPEFNTILDHFDDFDDETKQTMLEITTGCYNCRFCVQTDKTGEKDIVCRSVEYQGRRFVLCTLFPLYALPTVNDKSAMCLCKLFEFVDKLLSQDSQ